MTQQPPPPNGNNDPYRSAPSAGQQPQQPYGQQPYGQPQQQYGHPMQPYGQQPYGAPTYPGATPKAPLSQASRTIGWISVAIGVLAIIGCFGAWISVDLGGFGHISMNGYGQVSGTVSESPDDVKDGVLVTVFAVVVIVVGLLRGLGKIALAAAITILVMGVFTAATAIYDASDVSSNTGANVGWGLWLCLVASIGMVGVGIAGIIKRQ